MFFETQYIDIVSNMHQWKKMGLYIHDMEGFLVFFTNNYDSFGEICKLISCFLDEFSDGENYLRLSEDSEYCSICEKTNHPKFSLIIDTKQKENIMERIDELYQKQHYLSNCKVFPHVTSNFLVPFDWEKLTFLRKAEFAWDNAIYSDEVMNNLMKSIKMILQQEDYYWLNKVLYHADLDKWPAEAMGKVLDEVRSVRGHLVDFPLFEGYVKSFSMIKHWGTSTFSSEAKWLAMK
jgi:hypothetical protein